MAPLTPPPPPPPSPISAVFKMEGGKETILPVILCCLVAGTAGVMVGDELPPPPPLSLPPPPPLPGKPLKADADFLTPGKGDSSIAAGKPPPAPEVTIMDAVIREDEPEVIGESGGEA